ncbi:DUF2586 domain-containing protein [Maridesulfovibrio ferrireducens]|uniref:DUF2586 domain-containing protein n=1 Tax=Maridesulfovibrio ferrireducens TaxID=246191 RepID=UPI001A1B7814|nr:DUF2586 domain-containing protein [Maridesulfovibrio ferrireducens]MBI9109904.1 DUF2586 family protein [Maridesulfovibrio ferrireducens]
MLGRVQVNNLNLMQGEFKEVENYFLFIGRGSGTNEGKLVTVNSDTELDDVLGANEFNLKTHIEAAKLNAGQNWVACVYPLAADEDLADAIDACMELASVEAIVVTDPLADSVAVEALQAKAELIMGKYMRPLFFMGTTRAMAVDESWSDFTAAVKPIVSSIAADQVMVVPTLWGMDLGTLAGRLCNRSVTIADSPMRVATGPLLGAWSAKPVDKDGRAIDMSILQDLESSRLSVPQWYPDYPGVYWADGNMLDVPAGDYQMVENLRVVQKAMRRIYVLAVARIADRKLNSTPNSIEANKLYFMRPLFSMAKSVEIMGIQFPGEIKPPKDSDIVISWKSKYEVEIYLVVTPYNSPKHITCNLLLNLQNQAEA